MLGIRASVCIQGLLGFSRTLPRMSNSRSLKPRSWLPFRSYGFSLLAILQRPAEGVFDVAAFTRVHRGTISDSRKGCEDQCRQRASREESPFRCVHSSSFSSREITGCLESALNIGIKGLEAIVCRGKSRRVVRPASDDLDVAR
jgi:hypothetical protein